MESLVHRIGDGRLYSVRDEVPSPEANLVSGRLLIENGDCRSMASFWVSVPMSGLMNTILSFGYRRDQGCRPQTAQVRGSIRDVPDIVFPRPSTTKVATSPVDRLV